MNLVYCATLAGIRRVSEQDRSDIKRLEWNPHELIELKLMDRRQLMGLMVFCNIRTYNEMPVIACTDDELRMAYLVWRGHYSIDQRTKWTKKIGTAKEWLETVCDGIIDWFDRS